MEDPVPPEVKETVDGLNVVEIVELAGETDADRATFPVKLLLASVIVENLKSPAEMLRLDGEALIVKSEDAALADETIATTRSNVAVIAAYRSFVKVKWKPLNRPNYLIGEPKAIFGLTELYGNNLEMRPLPDLVPIYPKASLANQLSLTVSAKRFR